MGQILLNFLELGMYVFFICALHVLYGVELYAKTDDTANPSATLFREEGRISIITRWMERERKREEHKNKGMIDFHHFSFYS